MKKPALKFKKPGALQGRAAKFSLPPKFDADFVILAPSRQALTRTLRSLGIPSSEKTMECNAVLTRALKPRRTCFVGPQPTRVK